MKVWSPLSLAAVVVLVGACPQEEAPPAGRSQPEAAAPQVPDTLTPPPGQATVAETQRPEPPVTRRTEPRGVSRVDQPFTTADTGTVRPGMSEAEVLAVWGQAVARRQEGAFTYLHFRNGCEASCGMYDIVILEGDQVVDAVVRFPGHVYAGVSSSPPGRQPLFTPPDSVRGGADA